MQHAYLTVDLGFGDAGKGSIVDFLTRERNAQTVIRYNGGAQAGHRVVTPDGKSHVFAQFGSGTLAGADTHLSRFMLLEPLAMMAEETHLQTLGVSDAFARTTIDERALVTTPFQRAVNRLKELARGDQRHGSCGMGIGETMSDALSYGDQVLRAGDLLDLDRLHEKLTFLRSVNQAKIRGIELQSSDLLQNELKLLNSPDWADWLMEAYQDFAERAQIVGADHLKLIMQRKGTVIFEGAQGVLLDEWHGFHPHTTWSTTTLTNAETLLREVDYSGEVTRIGITRAYATRHGAGPFVSEDVNLTQLLPDAANVNGDWQQGFRVGWLDLVMLRYACEVVGKLDILAVTCLDRLAELPEIKVCNRYLCGTFSAERILHSPIAHDLDYQAQITGNLFQSKPLFETVDTVEALIAKIEYETGIAVGILSSGTSANDKSWK